MKKLLLGITILAFVLVATSTMAAGPKVPKALCLDFTSSTDVHQLAIKSLANIPTSDGAVKMYAVLGNATGICENPVYGSGYIVPPGNIFYATYNGKCYYSGLDSYTLRSWELYFDLTTNTGTIYTRFDYDDGTRYVGAGTGVTAIDCSGLPRPTQMATEGTAKAEGR